MARKKQRSKKLLTKGRIEDIRNDPVIRCRLSPAEFARYDSRGKWKYPKHLQLLNEKLLEIANRDINRLAVFMGPRHGKSELISKYFPAWYLGTRPEDRIILASYEADFAATWGRRARELLEEHGPLFGVEVSDTNKAAHRWEIKGWKGGMMTAGAGGPITGKGGDVIVVDDPVKNADDANSQSMRERMHDWWKSTLYTRLEPDGAVVLVMTRWHEDDLGGRLLDISDEDWEIIKFPAICEEEGDVLGRKIGDPLWPERFPLKRLNEIKAEVGEYWWNAMYQQRPHPLEGGLLKTEWLRYWTTDPEKIGTNDENGNEIVGLPTHNEHSNFQGWDLAISAKETADYTVCCTGKLDHHNKNVYILDWTRDHVDFPTQVKMVQSLWQRWMAGQVAIETNAYQVALPQQLRLGTSVPIKEVKRFTDKVTRITSRFTAFENHKVFLPLEHPQTAEFKREYTYFPQARHDDMLDATELMLSLCVGGTVGINVTKQKYEFAGWGYDVV
jgi:predicted phage terminase large subunit-like protein